MTANLRAVARINRAAIERNCRHLRAQLTGGAQLCAVVKADGYGHGAADVARAALAAGARRLAVATAGEAAALRAAGVDAPLLVLGALSRDELAVALAARADVVAWSEPFLDALPAGRAQPISVHLKLDVGMGRLGARTPAELEALAQRIAAADGLELAGAMTHFPCADEDPALTRRQLAAFVACGTRLRAVAPRLLLHAANSAATLSLPESHLDFVRCGVAIYGLDPFGEDPAARGLEPALELRSWVASLRRLEAGETVGYGGRFRAARPTWIATLPIGYGDGYRRAFSDNGEVLIGGRRHPVAGRVSMDNLAVDVGPDPRVRVGDVAILIGRQGEQRLGAEQLARRIDTINYEIVTGLQARVTRRYHADGGG